MVRTAVAVAAFVGVILTVGPAAQQPQTGQTPVFRTSVDLVHLDVSVLDKDRKPVRGLTEKDFTVVEDGKPQSIVAFSAVDVPENPPKPAAWSYRVANDVQTNEGIEDPEGRLFVVLMDDAMIPMHAPSLATARDVAKKFIERVTPSDRVAVVFSATGKNQDFTNDRGRLVAAVNTLKSGHASHLLGWDLAKDPASPVLLPSALEIPGPPGDPDIMYRNASMNTLRSVAETLISAPQRRKALVFISPGIVVDTVSAAMIVANGPLVNMAMKDANEQLMREMPELFNRMRRANVTIYPVDPCGNGGFEGYVMSAAANLASLKAGDTEPNALTGPDNPTILKPMATATGVNWLNPGYVVPRPDQLAEHVSQLSMDFLEAAAANTGGKAVVNTNDFDEGLDDIFEENSSYYLLGYQQPLGQLPGTAHRLTVTVNRPGVFVRTRSGYDTAPLPKPPKAGKTIKPPTPLDLAIAGAVANGAFPMRVALAPFVVPGKKDPVVTVTLGMAQPPVKERTNYSVDVQTNVYTIEGRPVLIGQKNVAKVVVVPTNAKDRPRYELYSSVMLPPGRYQLRISAHRPLDNVTGSVYADVEVPDFTAPLAVSGVAVEMAPTGAFAPRDAFDSFLPVVPTSTREFSTTQDVSVFTRLYQGGKNSAQPVEVKTRIADEFDSTVGEGKDLVYGNQFHVGGRAADYRFAVPVKTLKPGLYLLTLEFTLRGGATVTRSVQFRVIP